MTTLADVLHVAGVPERITQPARERFVTVKLNGGGAIQRVIGSGKTPVPFTGYRVRTGQFIYSRIDARNGAFAIVPDELDGAVVSKDFPVFEIRRDRIDDRYLRHFFASGQLEREIRARSRGATNRQRIREDEFLRFPIALPPLSEQRRIAAILDHADALRAKRRQVLAHLDTLTQSIFHEMFGGLVWPTAPLAEVVRAGTLVTYGIVQAGPEFEGGVPYIRTRDIVAGKISVAELRHTDPAIAARFERSTVRTGDIVMSIRATVGTTAVVPSELDGANLTQGTARIAPSQRAIGPFLMEYLRSPAIQHWIQGQVKGATFREITLGRLRELEVWLPPIELQMEFVDRAHSVGARMDAQDRVRAYDDELLASLQSRAFRGEL